MPAPLHLRPAMVGLVAVGGVAGTFSRHGLGLLFPEGPRDWPVTTFAINIAGAFLLGLLLEALSRRGRAAALRRAAGEDAADSWATPLRLGLGTGFMGAFTTYSTLAVDTDLLVHRGLPASAAGYAIATVLAGLVTCACGIAVGARVAGRGARVAVGIDEPAASVEEEAR